jgi:hypothetical protein
MNHDLQVYLGVVLYHSQAQKHHTLTAVLAVRPAVLPVHQQYSVMLCFTGRIAVLLLSAVCASGAQRVKGESSLTHLTHHGLNGGGNLPGGHPTGTKHV